MESGVSLLTMGGPPQRCYGRRRLIWRSLWARCCRPAAGRPRGPRSWCARPAPPPPRRAGFRDASLCARPAPPLPPPPPALSVPGKGRPSPVKTRSLELLALNPAPAAPSHSTGGARPSPGPILTRHSRVSTEPCAPMGGHSSRAESHASRTSPSLCAPTGHALVIGGCSTRSTPPRNAP